MFTLSYDMTLAIVESSAFDKAEIYFKPSLYERNDLKVNAQFLNPHTGKKSEEKLCCLYNNEEIL